MSNRALFSVAALALVVRFAALWLLDGPGNLDSSYSVVVGQELAAGMGLSEPFIWHWLHSPESILHPAGDYWPPGESLLIALATLLFGSSFRAAQIPNLLCAAAMPLLAILEARRVGLSERLIWWAAILALAAGPYFARFSTADAFAPFAVAGSVSLYLSARRKDGFGSLLAGVAAGCAQLFRADGFMLLAARSFRPIRFSLLACLGFLLIASPLAVRSFLEFGGQLGIKSIWLAEYNDIFRPNGTPFAEWIAIGPAEIGRVRLQAAFENVLTVAELPGWLLLPFAIAGCAARRSDFRAHLRYLLALWAVMTLLFPFPSMHGALAHSLAALLPAAVVASVLGLDVAIARFAGILRWEPNRAKRDIGGIFVAGSVVASLGIALQLAGGWNEWNRVQRGIAAQIASIDNSAAVASADPATLFYYLHRPAVVLPNLPFPEALPILRGYGVTVLVVGPELPRSWTETFVDSDPPEGLEMVANFERYRIFRVLSP